MKLTDLKHGTRAVIKDISTVNEMVKQRLIDLGLMEGQEICMKCKMPFGGPIMIEVCGQCISLRLKEASSIGVK